MRFTGVTASPKRLAAVEEELKPNSGKTLRDDVKKILRLIEAGEPRTGTL